MRQDMKDAVRRIREPFRKINCPLANQLKLPVFSAKVKAKIVFEISGKRKGRRRRRRVKNFPKDVFSHSWYYLLK